MHVYVSGIWNTLGVPLSEEKAIPHCIVEDIAEKTQCKLQYVCMEKYLFWQLLDISKYRY